MKRLSIVSDFNIDLVGKYLSVDRSEPVVSIDTSPFGQLFQTLQTEIDSDTVFVWARPESISRSYAALLDGEVVNIDSVLNEVDQFVDLIRRQSERVGTLMVASFITARNERGLGMLDWSIGGHSYVRARMNIRLTDALATERGVYILDAEKWIDSVESVTRSAKHWYAIKCPFTEVVCKSAAADIKTALRGVLGQSRKLVVLDLDDTLWGGVVGETGWQGIRLGGHDHIGEAFVDFQSALKALGRRGIQLALVSKNDEAIALEAVDHHPSMVLGRRDLAGWRINWNDKAKNIVDLVEELNLGLASVVFIDDNPTERARVREALPEVFVPDWPKDPTRYAETLRTLECFDQASVTDEDRKRTLMYAVERERRSGRASFQSLEEWLLSIDVRVETGPLNDTNIGRTTQLLNKTNQLNLRTRRLSEASLLDWEKFANHEVTVLNVSDRFGDLGLTGVISWEFADACLEIVDFVLSCRAMGRKVESFMTHLAVESALAMGLSRVRASAIPTERNGPCLEYWRNESGFEEVEPNVFEWRTAQPFDKPAVVNVEQ